MTTADNQLGLVVVHFGAPEPTLRCLRSIAANPTGAAAVVVVDNGPFPSRLRIPSRLRPDLAVTRLPCADNPGFGGGANRGVELLSRSLFCTGWVILNHDVEIRPGFLRAAAGALRDGGVGAAGGPIRLDHPDGPLWYAGGRLRRLTGTVMQSRSRETVHHLGSATGSQNRTPLYLEHLTSTRFRPYRSRLYRAYLALIHAPYVAVRSLLVAVGGGKEGPHRARAVLRGYRKALATVWRVERRP